MTSNGFCLPAILPARIGAGAVILTGSHRVTAIPIQGYGLGNQGHWDGDIGYGEEPDSPLFILIISHSIVWLSRLYWRMW